MYDCDEIAVVALTLFNRLWSTFLYWLGEKWILFGVRVLLEYAFNDIVQDEHTLVLPVIHWREVGCRGVLGVRR